MSSTKNELHDTRIPHEDASSSPQPETDGQEHDYVMRPFFVLVEDTNSKEVVHPDVHYIFSDDDQEILTAATLNATDTHGNIDQCVVIVDMAADGRTVSKTASLSSHWQVSTAEVDYAPSWHGVADASHKDLLLKLSGNSTLGASDSDIPAATSLPDLISLLDHELTTLELQMATYDDSDIPDPVEVDEQSNYEA